MKHTWTSLAHSAACLAALLLAVFPALAAPEDDSAWPNIVKAKTYDELKEKWCAAARDKTHIFVLPASLFVDSRELMCDSGPYKMYRVMPSDDKDDFEYYIDPPFGAENRLGCDGKAGVKVKVVAVNCRPE